MSSDPQERVVTTHGPAETHRLAGDILTRLQPGAVLALHGELGSGKTCFVQGLARALGIRRPVNSPTFTLVNEYPGAMPLFHIDLYRIGSAREALDLGLDEYLHGGRGVTAIEWAERVQDLLPCGTVHLFFRVGNEPDERVIRIGTGGTP